MELLKAIRRCGRLRKGMRLLVAVSGGPDSVALLDALCRLGYDCTVAHCNFHLRAEESDDDEQFVRGLSARRGAACVVKDFDTKLYSQNNGVSIEMAARELRYGWFEQLRQELGLDVIVVGHNADDNVETFFLNLLRGTGIQGVRGMEQMRGLVCRPMLDVSRDEIMQYLQERNLDFRIDRTNSDTAFLRNRIRHKVIPEMKAMNPSFLATMRDNFDNLRSVAMIFEWVVEQTRGECVRELCGRMEIDGGMLRRRPGGQALLFALLQPYGFAGEVVRGIYGALDHSGARFLSPTHEAVVSRGIVQVVQRTVSLEEEYWIDGDADYVGKPVRMRITTMLSRDVQICGARNMAYLDAGRLRFPLRLRHWREGDRFFPFGIRGSQKVSDFFNNNKISSIEKRNIWLLESGGDIVWIVGYRIDRRFCVSQDTERVVLIEVVADEA